MGILKKEEKHKGVLGITEEKTARKGRERALVGGLLRDVALTRGGG